jgi:hypothetical protein
MNTHAILTFLFIAYSFGILCFACRLYYGPRPARVSSPLPITSIALLCDEPLSAEGIILLKKRILGYRILKICCVIWFFGGSALYFYGLIF